MLAYTSTTSITIDWLLVIVIMVSYMITTINDAEFSTDTQCVKITRYRKIDPDYNIQ